MTDFYKVIENGYITGIGTNGNDTAEAITEAEYNQLLAAILDAPTAPEGYTYLLNATTIEWELVELPEPTPTEDEALTRYANELTGGNAENIQEATETLIKIVKEDK